MDFAFTPEDVMVVVVREGEGSSLVPVPTDRPGITRRPLDPISGEKTFEVAFDGLEITADDRLGPAS